MVNHIFTFLRHSLLVLCVWVWSIYICVQYVYSVRDWKRSSWSYRQLLIARVEPGSSEKKTRSAAGPVVTAPPRPVAHAFNPSPQMAEAPRF